MNSSHIASAISADVVSELESALTRRVPATLDFLQELVAINSFTANPEGVNRNAQRIIEQFAPLGFKARQVPCNRPGTGNHLILDSGGDGRAIACIAHLDTVYSVEEEAENNFVWQPEADRIYGPGVADIKGGTALIWMVLSTLSETNPEVFKATRWILLWNAAEEVLSPDFGGVCLEALPSTTRACLVFEPGFSAEEGFNIVSARKGSGKFHIQVTGRSAHSGNDYAHGANAIHQIARLVDRLAALTDLARGTTVNVGVVSGGTVTNRVPHEAEISLELRAFDHEHYFQVKAAILDMAGEGDVVAADDGFPCRIAVELQGEMPPWPENAESQQLVALWQKAAAACGNFVRHKPRGGLSDGNHLWNHFPTLDALGPVGGNLHASERSADGTKVPEYLEPASLVPKALINCLAIQELLSANSE